MSKCPSAMHMVHSHGIRRVHMHTAHANANDTCRDNRHCKAPSCLCVRIWTHASKSLGPCWQVPRDRESGGNRRKGFVTEHTCIPKPILTLHTNMHHAYKLSAVRGGHVFFFIGLSRETLSSSRFRKTVRRRARIPYLHKQMGFGPNKKCARE